MDCNKCLFFLFLIQALYPISFGVGPPNPRAATPGAFMQAQYPRPLFFVPLECSKQSRRVSACRTNLNIKCIGEFYITNVLHYLQVLY